MSMVTFMTYRIRPSTGGVRVDIYRRDADGKAIEHWDALQLVGDPKNAAPWGAPNAPRANPNACSEEERQQQRLLT
jgi:hypothetical protein